MTRFQRVYVSKAVSSGNPNMITVVLDGRKYDVNRNTLNRFANGAELKAVPEKFLGYAVPDIWFHRNRSGTWAIATGANPPAVWPEDAPVEP